MFEVHITTNPIEESEILKFKKFCDLINAKPILIELPEGAVKQQPMISIVFKDIEQGTLKAKIKKLEASFIDHGYSVVRTKVEVPLAFMNEGAKEYPDYKGQYFEWHGKVEFEDLNLLKNMLIRTPKAHLSANALKNQPNRRFVTVRSYGTKSIFQNQVRSIKYNITNAPFQLIKDEYEYCIYDSNKAIDNGWIDIPELTDANYLHLIAFEGFLRRTSESNEKFILKGSLLTRQYLQDIHCRNAADLDFLYGEYIEDIEQARTIFTEWVTQVTENQVIDEVTYKSFKENEFWRMIDYAMDDDFPTTNTDLSCYAKDQEINPIGLDISWNLPLEEEPIPLLYRPIEGEPFTIPYTVPISTQIAWKLHQTIVRPRPKDLLDILLLLESNSLSEQQKSTICEVYINECEKDRKNPLRLEYYTEGKVSQFLTKERIQESQKRYGLLESPFGFELTTSIKYLDTVFKLDFDFNDIQGLTKKFEEKLKKTGLVEKIKEVYPEIRRKIEQQKQGEATVGLLEDEMSRGNIESDIKTPRREKKGSFWQKFLSFFKT